MEPVIIYVDGSASTNDEGVHEALMDAAEAYLDLDEFDDYVDTSDDYEEEWTL